MRVQKFVIRGILPTRNEAESAARTGIWKAAQLKEAADALVCSEVRDKVEAVREYPVRLRVLWVTRDERSDPDNISAAKKYLLDALQCCKRCAACEENRRKPCTCRSCKKPLTKKKRSRCMCCPKIGCTRHANILRNDGRKEINSFVDFFAVDKENPRIIVEITEEAH
tara:strand:- start:36 stop:539 length:504 start_codon:yes stop_codon:yes gene_type:complete